MNKIKNIEVITDFPKKENEYKKKKSKNYSGPSFQQILNIEKNK